MPHKSHVPSGFWTRLIARIRGDSDLISMATIGFSYSLSKCQFKWVTVKKGLMLKFGEFPVFTLRELPDGEFFPFQHCKDFHYLDSITLNWVTSSNQNRHGIEVIVNDLLPVLKVQEVQQAYENLGFDGLTKFSFVSPEPDLYTSMELSHEAMTTPPPTPTQLLLPSIAVKNSRQETLTIDLTQRKNVTIETVAMTASNSSPLLSLSRLSLSQRSSSHSSSSSFSEDLPAPRNRITRQVSTLDNCSSPAVSVGRFV